jgi:hypothetical protein
MQLEHENPPLPCVVAFMTSSQRSKHRLGSVVAITCVTALLTCQDETKSPEALNS